MSRRRVVVTGLGCVSPVGNTVADSWANLLAGQSGIDLITKFDASNFACKIAGEVKGLDLESYISAKDARAMDSFIHFGIAAAAQAVEDAGLPTGEALSEEFATRIACVIGSGIGGLPGIESEALVLAVGTPGDDATPFIIHNRKREDCRITAAPARLAAGTLVVDPQTAKRLQLSAGDQVRAVALSAARESK